MRDILIYGALAIFVLAFILVKLSDRKEVSKDKPFFGGLVDGQKASKKAFLWSVVIAVGSSIYLSDGKFTFYSRYGGEGSTVTLDSRPGEFYFVVFLLVVLPILVAIWEGVKILRQQR
jgi:magnesium-transporting ATPase (P-type)|tara:strand:- start:2318 stop:2671 length:354 start_codon:yes stop_codon:yes gene_type:complete